MTIPEPEVRPFAYQISCVPFDDPYSRGFTYLVKRIEGDVWGVTEDGFDYFYNAEGDWSYRSTPGCRFDLDGAIQVAKDLSRKATVNGHTVGDALARIAEREAGA